MTIITISYLFSYLLKTITWLISINPSVVILRLQLLGQIFASAPDLVFNHQYVVLNLKNEMMNQTHQRMILFHLEQFLPFSFLILGFFHSLSFHFKNFKNLFDWAVTELTKPSNLQNLAYFFQKITFSSQFSFTAPRRHLLIYLLCLFLH